MVAVDLLINEVAERFGIGGRAAPLMSELLSLMTDQQTGGVPGFIDRFKQAGMDQLVSTWISSNSNHPITPNQIESALGRDTIDRLAYNVGLPNSTVSSALTFLTPEVIDYLTPDGVVPSSLPQDFSVPPSKAPGIKLTPALHVGSTLRNLLPYFTVVLVGFLGYRFYHRALESHSAAMQPVAANFASGINSTLRLSNNNGKIKFSGVVPDEKSRQQILDQLGVTFGDGNLSGNLTVDHNAKPSSWLGNLGAALRDFRFPGAELHFDGNAIAVGGLTLVPNQSALVDRLKGVFGSTANIELIDPNTSHNTQLAIQRTKAALARLGPGFTPQDLVKVLNLETINFTSGSATIPDEKFDLLREFATAIMKAPQATVIEVGGHTDNTGNPAGNKILSQQRADAVCDYLIKQSGRPTSLTAKGYGDSKPIAGNDTEESRSKNRRIEFTVVN